MRGKWRAQRADGGAHAARGFVGGAAYQWLLYLCRKIKFQCRTRLCGWCSWRTNESRRRTSRFQCRTRLCGWCNVEWSAKWRRLDKFQCRTRLCGWCSAGGKYKYFVSAVFQCRTRLCGWCSAGIAYLLFALSRFQCRTRLCGWCNDSGTYSFVLSQIGFNAARGFVGGATTIGQFDEASVLFQCRTRLCGWCSEKQHGKYDTDRIVSMPHAALWVVQHWNSI